MRRPPASRRLLAKSAALLTSTLFVLWACDRVTAPPGRGLTAISGDDAALIGGVPGFTWLKPIAQRNVFTGTFDATREPVVEICWWQNDACVTPLVSRLTDVKVRGVASSDPEDDEPIDEAGEEWYGVRWFTKRLNLDPAKTYRIRVLEDNRELGFADVDVVRNAREKRFVDRSKSVPLVAGKNLLIRFRIAEGAAPPQVLDHFLIEAAAGGPLGAQTAGESFDVRITAQDAENNTVTSFTSNVDLGANLAGSGLGATAAFTAGVLPNHSITLTQAGQGTITATSTAAIATGSATFVVNPNVLHHFKVEAAGGGPIGPQISHVPFDVKFTANDAFENLTPYSGTVEVTSNRAGSAGLGTSAAFAGGVLASHSITLTAGGEESTITATRTGGVEVGTSNAFAVEVTDMTLTTTWTATAGSEPVTRQHRAVAGQSRTLDIDGVPGADISANAVYLPNTITLTVTTAGVATATAAIEGSLSLSAQLDAGQPDDRRMSLQTTSMPTSGEWRLDYSTKTLEVDLEGAAAFDEVMVQFTAGTQLSHALDAEARLEDVPSSGASVRFHKDNGVQLSSAVPIGELEISLRSPGLSAVFVPEDNTGLVMDEANGLSLHLRSRSAQEMTVRLEPLQVLARHVAGANFLVETRSATTTASVLVEDTPAEFEGALRPFGDGGQSFLWRASAPVNALRFDVRAASALGGRLSVQATSAPTSFTLNLPEVSSFGTASVTSGTGGGIGQLQFSVGQATSGGSDPANDLFAYNLGGATGRLTGVRSFSFQLDPFALDYSSDGSRPLDLNVSLGSKTAQARVPAGGSQRTLTFGENTAPGGGSRLAWSATSGGSQMEVFLFGLSALGAQSPASFSALGVPAGFSVTIPEDRAAGLLAVNVVGATTSSGGPRIDVLRGALGPASLPTISGNDKLTSAPGSVAFKLTNVKTVTRTLVEPIQLDMAFEPTLNGGTLPMDVNVQWQQTATSTAAVAGTIDRPGPRFQYSITVPAAGSTSPIQLNVDNGGRPLTTLSLSAFGVLGVPTAQIALANVTRLAGCLASSGACRDAASISPLPNYAGYGDSPPQSSTEGGMSRPYPASASVALEDFGTSGTSTSASSMITMNANIDRGGVDRMSFSNVRFHRLFFDAGSHADPTFLAFTSLGPREYPRFYLYMNSHNTPFVMNGASVFDVVQHFQVGTDGSPAVASQRIFWLPGAKCLGSVTSGLCLPEEAPDFRFNGVLSCGGARTFILRPMGAATPFNVGVGGGALGLPICSS